MKKRLNSFSGMDVEILKFISEKVNDQPIHVGYLEKKSGSFLGSWQKRYFKLHSTALLYSKSEKEDPVGILEKEDVLHVDTIFKDNYYVIRLKVKSKDNKLYELRSKSKVERDGWLDALRNQWIKKEVVDSLTQTEETLKMEAPLFYFETLKESNLSLLYKNPDYSKILFMDQEEETRENILYDENDSSVLHACTIYKLIHWLTDSKGEGEFIKLFLLTYNSFITSLELLNLLHLRFNTPPPWEGGGEEENFSEFYNSKLLKIRLRFCFHINVDRFCFFILMCG
jgi:hypothetical protein